MPSLVEINLFKIRSFRSLLKDLTKPNTKVKSGDLCSMHDRNVMPMRMLSSDWLYTCTHVTEKGFLRSFSSDLRERIKGSNLN